VSNSIQEITFHTTPPQLFEFGEVRQQEDDWFKRPHPSQWLLSHNLLITASISFFQKGEELNHTVFQNLWKFLYGKYILG